MQANASNEKQMKANASKKSKCKQMQTNASKYKQMQTSASKCKQKQTNANKYKQMQGNGNKCKQRQANISKCKQMYANASRDYDTTAALFIRFTQSYVHTFSHSSKLECLSHPANLQAASCQRRCYVVVLFKKVVEHLVGESL